MRERIMLFEECMTQLTVEQISRSIDRMLLIFKNAGGYEHVYFSIT
jgi:hypothetical protein